MTDIVLDTTRIVGRRLKGRLPTGVDRVCLAYLEHFEYAQFFMHIRGQGIVLTPKDSATLRTWLLTDNPPQSESQYASLDWITRQLPTLLRSTCAKVPRNALFFNVGHSGVEHPRYVHWLQKNAVRPVYMVHDLIPITHPEYCRDGEVQRHTQRMSAIIQTAAGLITNSQETLNELNYFAHQHKLTLAPHLVAHLGIPKVIEIKDTPSPLPCPYFVMLGTIEPRKNHLLILNVWRKLIERHGKQTPKLVLIGQRGWECEQVVDMLERCPSLKDVVIELPKVTDQQLSAWLQHTQALLFPSFAEGFGLPLIEAMQQGIRVIASDLPVFREIVGDAPHYLDPIDGLGWLAAIEKIWFNKSKMKNTSLIPPPLPTWSEHFRRLDSWLARV